jgi:hypothetical protein
MLDRKLVFVIALVTSMTIVGSGCLGLDLEGQDGISQVQGLDLEENTVYLGLGWDPLEGADHYIVMRDGEELGQTSRCFFNDSAVEQGINYSYRVIGARSMAPFGSERGPASDPKTGTLLPLTMDDDGFRLFAMDSAEVIQGICYDLQEAGMALDLTSSRELSRTLVELSTEYLTMSEGFDVSCELDDAMGEYRSALDDFISAGERMDQGIGSLDQGMIEEGIDHSYQGAEHMENMVGML